MATVWPCTYPSSRRSDHVDVYRSKQHGEVRVQDPYRWMEENSPETQEWMAAQAGLTNKFLHRKAGHEELGKLKDDLQRGWDFPRFSQVEPRGEGDALRWYWMYNEGLQPHNVWYRSTSSAFPDFSQGHCPVDSEVWFDENLLSEDYTTSIKDYSFSKCGKYFAYGLSRSGSDKQKVYVRPTSATFRPNKDGSAPSIIDGQLPEELAGIKWTSLTWTHDSKGFFYQRFEDLKQSSDEKLDGRLNLFCQLFYHRIGTPQSEDVLVMKDDEHEKYTWGTTVTELDGRYLILQVYYGSTPRSRVMICDLEDPQNVIGTQMKWITICPEFEHSFVYLANDGNRFYVRIDKDAPRRRVVRFDLTENGRSDFADVIAEDPDALLEASPVVHGEFILAKYSRNIHSELWLFTLAGERLERLEPIPNFIGRAELVAKRDRNFFGVALSNFTSPAVHYSYDFNRPEGQRWVLVRKQEAPGYNADEFIVEQKWFKSKDGTSVPMFLIRHRDTPLDGSAPAFQYGYGGFAIANSIRFTYSWLTFAKRYRAVIASVNVRGGNEFGEQWHEAGAKENKTNVFDDFIAASEWLVENKYAARGKVILHGSSEGGLLVLSSILRAPQGLYGAALAEVAAGDMLRFAKYTVGRGWITEFGDPDTPEGFDYIYAYSPLHNIPPVKEKTLPPTLLMTAEFDDRVVPMHSFKTVATMQHLGHQALVRIDLKSGHGEGRSTDKYIEAVATRYLFAVLVLGLKSHEDEYFM